MNFGLKDGQGSWGQRKAKGEGKVRKVAELGGGGPRWPWLSPRLHWVWPELNHVRTPQLRGEGPAGWVGRRDPGRRKVEGCAGHGEQGQGLQSCPGVRLCERQNQGPGLARH